MKNKAITILVFILCMAIGFESVHLAFWLMNQPNTIMFWLGIIILSGIAFLVGTYVWKKISAWVADVFDQVEKESNDHDYSGK